MNRRPGRRPGPFAALLALLVGLTVLAGATVLSAGPALAHAELIRMVPAEGSTVGVAPTVIQLIFDEAVQPRYDVVSVTAPDGTRVSAGAPQVAQTVVRQPLTPLTAAGRYTVTYRLVSADGHLVSRRVGFTYRPAAGTSTATPTATPTAVAAPTAGPQAAAKGGAGRSPLVAVAVVVLVLLAGAAVLARRRRRPS